MIALRRLVRPVALLTLEGATVAALTALGSRSPFVGPRHGLAAWLRATAPGDVLVAVLRWTALGGAWWLLAGTLLYLGASLTRVPRAVRAVRWATLPAVRRAVDAALVASFVTGSLLAPTAAHASARAAPAATGPPPATAVRDGHAASLASLPPERAPSTPTATPPTTTPPTTTPTTATRPPLAPVVAVGAPEPAATSVVVAPCDNLWELSARRYAAATGRSRAGVGDGEVAPYWRAVCEQNRATLASGDPDLIYAGERVVLPPVR